MKIAYAALAVLLTSLTFSTAYAADTSKAAPAPERSSTVVLTQTQMAIIVRSLEMSAQSCATVPDGCIIGQNRQGILNTMFPPAPVTATKNDNFDNKKESK